MSVASMPRSAKTPVGFTFSTPLPSPTVSSDVEKIFMNNSLDDIKKVEEKLRFDIERKKDHLRAIVGERYRDLIDSADLITKLSHTSKEILNNVSLLKTRLGDVSQSISTDSGFSKDDTAGVPNAIYDRLLLIIPEEIYNNIDLCQPVDAALLYLLAGDICAHLQLSNSSSVVSSDQTQTRLSRCRTSLVTSCTNRLGALNTPIKHASSHMRFNEDKAIAWLAAFIAIDYLTPAQSYDKFLACRLDKLKAITAESTSPNAVSDAIHSYLSTAILTNSLFVGNSGAVLTEIEDRVSKICPPAMVTENEFVQFTLPHSVHDQLAKIVKHLAQSCQLDGSESLDSTVTYERLSDWLKTTKGLLVPKIPKLLQNVTTLRALQALCEEIAGVLTACCCQNYVPSVSEVWNDFFREPVIGRLEVLVHNNFDDIKTNLHQSLLKPEADNLPAVWSVAKSSSMTSWKKQPNFETSSMNKHACDLFVVGHFAGQQNSKSLQTAMASLDSLFALTREFIASGLPLDLREAGFGKMRQEASSFAYGIIELCKTQFENEQSSKSFEKLLDISAFSFSMTFLFNYIEDWLNNPKFSFVGKSAIASPKSSDPMCWATCRTQISKISADAFQSALQSFIASEIDENYSKSMESTLDGDNKQASKNHEMAWFSVEIEEEGDDGEKFVSKISVPQQPSLNVCSVISSLCRFSARSPAFLLKQNNVNAVIFGAIVQFYNGFISTVKSMEPDQESMDISSSSPVPEDCAIQHLFDFQLLTALLIGDYRRNQRFASTCIDVIHALESFIDPFDLNTVQPHLAESVRKYAKNVQSLFGLVLSLDATGYRGGKSVPSGPGHTDDHNVLRLTQNQGRLTALSIPFSQAQLHPV